MKLANDAYRDQRTCDTTLQKEVIFDTMCQTSLPELNLQWFAPEDEGRTFEPTERKIAKAREEGRVAKSSDVPIALIIIGGSLVILGFGRVIVHNLSELFRIFLGHIHTADISQPVYAIVLQGLWPVLLPFLLVSFSIAILGNVVQFGWAPSLKPITPDVSRISFKLGKWITRIFSTRGLFSLLLALVKLVVIIAVIFLVMSANFNKIFFIAESTLFNGLSYWVQIIMTIVLICGAVFLLISYIDYQFQNAQFRSELKMSREELKEELKESEGDAEVKKRIRQQLSEFLARNLPEDISRSQVVITNPTHFAVALRYVVGEMDAPLVTAKGRDRIALKMKELAVESDVPIVENKPLARALYAELEVGDEIPEEYYHAVVIVFKELFESRRMTAHV